MHPPSRFKYTSGFVLTGDEVIKLAQHLRLPYTVASPDSPEAWFRWNAAQCISTYMSRRNELLEPFNLQAVPLIKEKPTAESNEPEVWWMIPTSRTFNKDAIDPSEHDNSKKVKEAVMATGLPEEYLTRFRTYPNNEHPWTFITMNPPPKVWRGELPSNFQARPTYKTFAEYCEEHEGESEESESED